MKFVRYALALLVLFSAAAHAGQLKSGQLNSKGWQPSNAESDAFIKAYAYTEMRALMEEGLDLKVEAGTVSPKLAACLKQRMQLDALLLPMRPLVARSFSSRKSLRRATAFFRSPAGVQMKNTTARLLRNMLRQNAGAPARPDDAPPTFEAGRASLASAIRFSKTQAGQDFAKFEDLSLPLMGEADVLSPVTEQCAKQMKQ